MKKYFPIIILMFLVLAAVASRSTGTSKTTEAKMDESHSSAEAEKIRIYNAEEGTYEEVFKVVKSADEWKDMLTDEQFHVTREHGTERAFTGELHDNKKEGLYECVCCGNDLFVSRTKYDSKTGWPSFWEPIAEENVGMQVDDSLFMRRTEVHCSRCNAHLGHVFPDGPQPTGQRFCINSASLKFKEMKGQ